jgi:hypothetical protein
MERRDYAVCGFELREQVAEDFGKPLYQYTTLRVNNYEHDGKLYTLYPPVVGDTILLIDNTQDIHGTFIVIMRDISYSQYGSANWPYGKRDSDVGPHFTYIVERSTGVFRNEAPSEDEG